MMSLFAAAFTLFAGAAPSTTSAQVLDVRLNEIQVVGTHNSYHIRPAQRILDVVGLFEPTLPIGWDYTHAPLTEQFAAQAVRQIELDVFADPAGGLYAERQALAFFGEDPASGLPELDLPGFKVLHVQDLDFDSRCLTLVACLTELKAWSDANPTHVPVTILVEAKQDPIPDPVNLGFVVPLPIGAAELDDLDAEIRSVFPESQLLTPDDVRGTHATLETAILTDGWPFLSEVRGQVMFVMDNGGQVRDDYIAGYPSLAGRVMFAEVAVGQPEAAFFKRNSPVAGETEITDLVTAGYIVRTRADSDTLEARTGNTTRRDTALASGAQFVSTDYPVPDPYGNDYIVQLPGGVPARCNPVNAPADCLSAALDDPGAALALSGKKLSVRDHGVDPTRRRIKFVSKDLAIDTPLHTGPATPVDVGATLILTNRTTGESVRFDLPAGARWKGLGAPAGVKGYAYKDADGSAGPCRTVVAKQARVLKASCSAKNAPIGFDLDEASQGSLDVTVALGADKLHCMSFGGDVRRDQSSSGGKLGAFVARDAPPGGCELP